MRSTHGVRPPIRHRVELRKASEFVRYCTCRPLSEALAVGERLERTGAEVRIRFEPAGWLDEPAAIYPLAGARMRASREASKERALRRIAPLFASILGHPRANQRHWRASQRKREPSPEDPRRLPAVAPLS